MNHRKLFNHRSGPNNYGRHLEFSLRIKINISLLEMQLIYCIMDNLFHFAYVSIHGWAGSYGLLVCFALVLGFQDLFLFHSICISYVLGVVGSVIKEIACLVR